MIILYKCTCGFVINGCVVSVFSNNQMRRCIPLRCYMVTTTSFNPKVYLAMYNITTMKREGENWSLEYDEGVVIGFFGKGMPIEAFEEEVYPAFESILKVHKNRIVGTADHVLITDPFSKDVFEIWEQAARESAELPNYERAALTAEGIKSVSLRNKLSVPGAEFKTFDDHQKAIEWARGDGSDESQSSSQGSNETQTQSRRSRFGRDE